MSDRFQVDLEGMVDLLSRHLYSGPQVYLRELLQNAVDAVTARSAVDPEAPARIRLRTGRGETGAPSLEISDTGTGLTADEARELLATIGRSSKRDAALGTGRAEFIGQFGIGMLAAFMVAEQIEVRSRSARPGAAPITWIGRADGTFEVREADDSPGADIAIGSTIRILARPDSEHWLDEATVLGLALEYGSLLPLDVAMEVSVPGSGRRWRRITEPELPWRVAHPTPAARERALRAYCERTLGFTPLGCIDLSLPAAGVSGVAFVLPEAVSPGSGQHRVTLKRMLLGTRVERIMPEWAFFTRAVLDAEALSPTASREQVHDDEVLLAVREGLGEQLKQWALATLREQSAFARSFIETHHLALRSLARDDSELLDLITEILPFETTDGPMTLAAAARDGRVVYTTTTEAYRRIAAVARAQGLVVVNAGYVYDADLLRELGGRPEWETHELSSGDLVQVLRVPGLERELELAGPIARAREVLADEDCDVIVRGFQPAEVPAILLRDAEGEHRRELDRERDAAPGLWGGLLESFAEDRPQRSRTLVLNDDAPLSRRLLDSAGDAAFAAGLRALYLSAVMLAGEGLRARESTALTDAIGVLLDAALAQSKTPPADRGPAAQEGSA